LEVPDVVIQEIDDLSALLRSKGKIILERELVAIIEERYNFSFVSSDYSALNLLLDVFKLQPLPKNIAGFGGKLAPAWQVDPALDRGALFLALKQTYKVLLDAVTPLSLFDIKIKANRLGKKKVDLDSIHLAIKYCDGIEALGEDVYQVKLECLPSLADKAYRILFVSNTSLSLLSIIRKINHSMAEAGQQVHAPVRSLQSQLVNDQRFKAIGRSGLWTLSEWDNIRRDTIVNLMKECFHIKQCGATIEDVYEYVSSKRPDVSRNSVVIYITTLKDVFVRVSHDEYELASWGSKVYKTKKKRSSDNVREQFVQETKAIFEDKQVSVLRMNELVRELHDRTRIPTPTLYAHLRKSSLVSLEEGPSPRSRLVRFMGSDQKVATSAGVERQTVGKTIQDEILKYLLKQRNNKALIADVASHVMQVTNCKKPSFYLYLTRLQGVLKQSENNRRYCYIPSNSHSMISFPLIDKSSETQLRLDLQRATGNLSVENVDLVLFQLGKIFEKELHKYLTEVRTVAAFPVSSKDVDRLASMIDCVERNGIIKDKHVLTFLRQERNERAHGDIPSFEERERLMEQVPYLAGMFIDYIIFFNKKRKEL